MEVAIIEERKKSFKDSIVKIILDNINFKKNMEEYVSKLRKIKKNELINNKRNKTQVNELTEKQFVMDEFIKKLNEINPAICNEALPIEVRMECTLKELDDVNEEKLGYLLLYIRKILCRGYTSCSNLIVNQGYLTKLLTFFEGYNEQIFINAACAITNITAAFDEACKELIKNRSHYKLLNIMKKGSPDVKEQSLWILGNLIAENIETRNELLATTLVEMLSEILVADAVPRNLLKVTCWIVSNLCNGKPYPPLNRIEKFLKGLSIHFYSPDEGIVSDVLYAFTYITNIHQVSIEMVRKHINLNIV